MTNKEMRDYLNSYKTEYGEMVELATLVGEVEGKENTYFDGFLPVYEPRGKPKDPIAAKDAADFRAINTLYGKLRDDRRINKLPPKDANDWVDFHKVALPFVSEKQEPEEGKKRGRKPTFKSLPNWRIKLDDAFFAFVQDLPSNIGGRKTSTVAKSPKRTVEAQKRHEEFTGALRNLEEKPNRTSALAFLHVYKKYQKVMRLPRMG